MVGPWGARWRVSLLLILNVWIYQFDGTDTIPTGGYDPPTKGRVGRLIAEILR